MMQDNNSLHQCTCLSACAAKYPQSSYFLIEKLLYVVFLGLAKLNALGHANYVHFYQDECNYRNRRKGRFRKRLKLGCGAAKWLVHGKVGPRGSILGREPSTLGRIFAE
jgi:hypothetical protein